MSIMDNIPGDYCEKCRKFVSAILGTFRHPHMGQQTCLVCRKCGSMVYRRQQELEIA